VLYFILIIAALVLALYAVVGAKGRGALSWAVLCLALAALVARGALRVG